MVAAVRKQAKIRLVLLDDHDLVREGLKRILQSSGEFDVIGEAACGDRAIDLYRALKPDVIVSDLSMPGGDGIDAILALRRVAPHARVIVLTMHNDPHHAARALCAGADGFVGKDSASQVLIGAIRHVALGQRYIPSEIRAKVEGVLELLLAPSDDPPAPLATSLTMRELDILRYLSAGNSNREIADYLGISIKTVDTHRYRVLKKLVLRNNVDLTHYAIRQGLIKA